MTPEAPDDLGVKVGDVIADKYKIEECIGVGGMGAVMAARHLELGARVAIKILLREAARDPDAAERFSREARAMFQLKSEHVAKVLDAGVLPNGGRFMVLEYLTGTDLATSLLRGGPLPPVDSVFLILQACEAVAEAHALGIVHRDIKPQNLFVTKRVDGGLAVKVLDFGISKMPHDGTQMSLTHSSAVMGTPLYMSPEQLHSSANADARSDVWAIGVVLYQLLTGQLPFDAPSAPALYAKMLSTTPPSPSEIRAEIPQDLSTVVMRCLQRDREQRCQSVVELAALLEPFGPDSMSGVGARMKAVRAGNTDRTIPASESGPIAPAVATQNTWEGTTTRRRKTAAAMVVGIFVGVGFFVAAIVAWLPRASAVPVPTHDALASPSVGDKPPVAPIASSSSAQAISTIAPSATPSAAPAPTRTPTPSATVTAKARPAARPPTRNATPKASSSPDSILNQRTW